MAFYHMIVSRNAVTFLELCDGFDNGKSIVPNFDECVEDIMLFSKYVMLIGNDEASYTVFQTQQFRFHMLMLMLIIIPTSLVEIIKHTASLHLRQTNTNTTPMNFKPDPDPNPSEPLLNTTPPHNSPTPSHPNTLPPLHNPQGPPQRNLRIPLLVHKLPP